MSACLIHQTMIKADINMSNKP